MCGCGAELSSTTNPNHQLIDIGPLKWEQGNSGTRSNSHIFHEIYSLLQTVTHEIIAWAKPGMRVAELDAKAREMLGVYAPYFTHSLGHGVGIDIHEKPFLSSKSEDILLP